MPTLMSLSRQAGYKDRMTPRSACFDALYIGAPPMACQDAGKHNQICGVKNMAGVKAYPWIPEI